MDVVSPIPSLKDFVFGDKIGKGSYGVVYKACQRVSYWFEYLSF